MFKLLHALAVAAVIALPTVQVAAQPASPALRGVGDTAEFHASGAQLSITEWHESGIVSAVVPDDAELQGDEEEPPADGYVVDPAYGETRATHAAIAHQAAPAVVWVEPHVGSGAPRGPPTR